MSQGNNKDTGALILSLLITLGLIGGGLWFFGRQFFSRNEQSSVNQSPIGQSAGQSGEQLGGQSTTPPNPDLSLSQIETSQPNPQVLTIDGSVTLVALIKQFQIAYSQVNPAIPTTYGVPDGKPNGSNQGIQNLLKNEVVMAVSSRPIGGSELQAGLQAVPFARDAIAIVVGINNPFQGSLTLAQIKQIYQGQITNWSQVGGSDLPIKVINRPPASGTGSFFKDVVLLGEAFAPDSPNFVTLPRDETTPMLQALENNGIGYTTVAQAVNQQTVRLISIEGVSPADETAIKAGSYPLSRVVYLVVPQKTSQAVKQFIDLVLSAQGQQTVQRVGFLPLK
ncbi:MAG: phosphate ABC transporter substrate-binding protein [Timaviella obliquedivisa GSE-PSE-MK23-08B]|nr:phosphate ABC transporter substrate-binding protein [Timaviella obliquedivisa GSE-PSE-MK23-08B]